LSLREKRRCRQHFPCPFHLALPSGGAHMAAQGDLLDLGDAAPPPPTARPDAAAASEDPIAHLQKLFPTIERPIIEALYNDVANQEMDKAIESLLQITDDKVDRDAVAAAEQASADEILAMQVLQEMMDVEDKEALEEEKAAKAMRRIRSDPATDAKLAKHPKGVKEALLKKLDKIKNKAREVKAGGARQMGDVQYSQQYSSLLEDEDDAMKV